MAEPRFVMPSGRFHASESATPRDGFPDGNCNTVRAACWLVCLCQLWAGQALLRCHHRGPVPTGATVPIRLAVELVCVSPEPLPGFGD